MPAQSNFTILIGDHNDDDGNGHKEEIQTNDAWAPNYLLVVKIHILAIFIHSWTNEYKLFSRLKCPMFQYRVAELGSLSSGAKMAKKIFVKGVFTIFASNALF